MKTLVIYYSFTGNNEALANELRRRLDCEILRVTELHKRNSFTILLDIIFKRTPKIARPQRDLAQYDRLLLVAPIWAGSIATPMAALIASEKERLRDYAFISICTGPDGQLAKITEELHQLAGRMPTAVTQLKVNDLLPAEEKNKVRYASKYRLKKADFFTFNREIDQFVQMA